MSDSTLRFPLSEEFHVHHQIDGWVSLIHSYCEPITTEWDDEGERPVPLINGYCNITNNWKCQSCGASPTSEIRKTFAGFFFMNVTHPNPKEIQILRGALND